MYNLTERPSPGIGSDVAECSGTADTKPIHRDVFNSRCFGNVAFATALLDELSSSGTSYLEQISAHAEAGNLSEAADAAHSLKGASGIVGAQALSATAARVEAAGREGQLSTLLEMLDTMRDELDRCLADAETLRSELLSASAVDI